MWVQFFLHLDAVREVSGLALERVHCTRRERARKPGSGKGSGGRGSPEAGLSGLFRGRKTALYRTAACGTLGPCAEGRGARWETACVPALCRRRLVLQKKKRVSGRIWYRVCMYSRQIFCNRNGIASAWTSEEVTVTECVIRNRSSQAFLDQSLRALANRAREQRAQRMAACCIRAARHGWGFCMTKSFQRCAPSMLLRRIHLSPPCSWKSSSSPPLNLLLRRPATQNQP